MKKLLTLTLLSVALSGCFSSSSSSSKKETPKPLTEGSYVIQTASASWNDGASVVVGNILGNREIKHSIFETQKTDYTVSTYNNFIYHIGKYGIDEISKYDASKDLANPEWTISANDDGESLANPYKVVQISDDKAYVVRYGSANLWLINPTQATANDIITDSIDLSGYNVSDTTNPNMNDAVYYNGNLFVVMQRQTASWGLDTGYIAVIDTSDNSELDTGKGQDGLKGIPLNALNPVDSAMYNGYLYVAGRGDFTGSVTSTLDKIDLTTYQVTPIATDAKFDSLKTEDNHIHITDVAIVDNNNGYILIRSEDDYAYNGSSYIYPFNPSTGTVATKALNIDAIKDKLVSDITTDANGKLWIAVADAADPKVLVYDTDTNTQSGTAIELDMPPSKIEFLTIN